MSRRPGELPAGGKPRAVRAGEGAFATPAEFYDYWRKFPFKVSAQVQNQLQRLLTSTQAELAQLRARQPETE
jgi:hypothetical protein